MGFLKNRHFWLVLWHGVQVAWTAAQVADKVGLPMPVQVHEGIRIATAIEEAAAVHKLVKTHEAGR